MNATGLRDQRVSLYTRTGQGTDGRVRSVYLFSATRWGRLDDSAAAVRVAQDRLQMKVDAVCEFADEVTVPCPGLLKETVSGQSWWVRGVYGVRQLRRVIVGLDRISVDQFATFQVYEAADVADGTHLVDPAS